MKSTVKIILISIIALSILLVLLCNANDNYKKNKAPVIQAALDSYWNDFGRYPDSISDLVPKYLNEQSILKLFNNASMVYMPDTDRKHFRLGIPTSLMDMWIWSCKNQKWEYAG